MTNKPEKLDDNDSDDRRASSADSDEWPKGVAHQPSQPPPRDRTGERIGHYELRGQLGKGGMGVVYDAFDVRLQRNVALKLLSEDVIDDVERRRRFLREAKLTAKVSHPNIVALYEVAEVDNLIFLAMERVAGITLRQRLNEIKDKLPTHEAVRIAREVALGVAEAHRHGVIHRDIKPENIMISREGKVKLLDFGLAKALEKAQPSVAYQSTEISAVHGRVVGTLRYMSPEQLRGTGVDERSDVFAIGVVLYEMLNGTRPFRGATNTDVMASILKDLPTAITHISPALWRIVARCLSKSPDERYPNAGALAEALDSRFWASPFKQSLTRYWLTLAVLVLVAFAIPRVVAFVKTMGPPVRIVDLPIPKSTNTKAIFHYQEALKQFRAANWGAAEEELRTTTTLDPDIVEARFRLALTQMSYGAVRDSARDEFLIAAARKSGMTQRDQDLLEAFRPMFDGKFADVAKTLDLMEKLSKKYPNDAEIFLYLASFMRFDTIANRRAAAERAVQLDSEYADAMQMLSTTWFESDPNRAIEILNDCIRVAPSGSDCLGERARLESLQHRCVDAETDASLAMSGTHTSEWIVAFHPPLLYAVGKTSPEVLSSFQQLWNRPHTSTTESDKTYHRAMIAAAYGDFNAAKDEAQKGLNDPITSKNRADLERFTMLLVEIESELGNSESATSIAREFLKSPAEVVNKEGSPGTTYGERPSPADPTAYFARIAWTAGKISEAEFRSLRDAWLQHSRVLTPFEQEEMWGIAHVLGIESAAEANEALKNQPEKRSGAQKYDYGFKYFPRMAALGRAHWFAGNKSTAIPYLRATYERCDSLPTIFAIMQSNLLYAQALKEQNDVNAACKVYGDIKEHWGKESSSSVTFKKVHELLGAECPKASGESTKEH